MDTGARISIRWIASTLTAIAVIGPGAARGDVTNRGTYTQSIDIKVPEFHSIAPGIRLVYDSNVKNGPLGIGWLLQAGSQISRTASPAGSPRYNSTDQFWLDSMELIPCSAAPSSASCHSNGTHTTREESYQRITQDLNANTWTVWRPDGTQLSYTTRVGRVVSPDATLRWLLSAVTDTHGNRVSHNYACDAAGSYCRAEAALDVNSGIQQSLARQQSEDIGHIG